MLPVGCSCQGHSRSVVEKCERVIILRLMAD